MIDRNLFLDDFEATARRLARKGFARETAEEIRDLLVSRKALVSRVDALRADLNRSSARIGELYRAGNAEAAEPLKAETAKVKESIAAADAELAQLQERVDYLLLRVPNLPEDDCPEGSGEADNVVLRTEGYDPSRYEGKQYRPHWEIGADLGIFDVERAAKLSGSMFSLLRGDGARLLRALVQFALDLHSENYEEILPPHFVLTEILQGTGHLPKFANEAYKLQGDELWAIPTGEVPLTSLHRDEVVPFDELPKRYMAHTVCFRREAGAAGKDTRGMQRLHEFHKVELVQLCAAEQTQAQFRELVGHAERALQLLELPYRVVDLCCGDLTFTSTRIYDLEVYSPGVDRWLEVSSIGIFSDFQTRRGNSRYRDQNGKLRLLHALNGSALATPRVWAAVLEHGQQPDGTVRVPEVLVKYLGKPVIGRR
jgi:seryl-tRNA synthetase